MTKEDQLRILEEFARNTKPLNESVIASEDVVTDSSTEVDSMYDILETMRKLESDSTQTSMSGRNKKPETLNENVFLGMSNVPDMNSYRAPTEWDSPHLHNNSAHDGHRRKDHHNDSDDNIAPRRRRNRLASMSKHSGSNPMGHVGNAAHSHNSNDEDGLMESDAKDDIVNLLQELEQIQRGAFDTAATDPSLKEAINTKKTSNGTIIGDWEIKTLTEGQKEYSVINRMTGNSIANNLMLYEAALGIVRNLNKGQGLNTPSMKKILELEESFVRFKDKATSARRMAVKSYKAGDTQKGEILENEFELFRSKALDVKTELNQFVEGLDQKTR